MHTDKHLILAESPRARRPPEETYSKERQHSVAIATH